MPKARRNRAGRNNALRRLEYDLHVAAIYDHNAIIGEEVSYDGEYELFVHDRLWSALPAPSAPVAAYQENSFGPRISLEEYLRRADTERCAVLEERKTPLLKDYKFPFQDTTGGPSVAAWPPLPSAVAQVQQPHQTVAARRAAESKELSARPAQTSSR